MKRNTTVASLVSMFLVILLLAGLLAGCGAKSAPKGNGFASSTAEMSYDGYDYYTEEKSEYVMEYYPTEAEVPDPEGSAELNVTVLDASVERKLTYSADVRMETKTYHETLADIDSLIGDFNGYVEYSNVNDYAEDSGKTYARSADFVIQIPAGSLDGFLDALKTYGNVTSVSKRVTDITTSYYDTKSRLDALTEQEQRLLKMQDGASLSEMLEIENQITNIRYEINYLYNMMQVYEQQVAYSEVSLYLSEVVDYTELPYQNPTFGERIVQAFADSFEFVGEFAEGLLIVLIFLLPFLVVGGIITVVVVVLVRSSKKRKAQNKQPQTAPIPQQPMMQPQPPVQEAPKSEDK